jgi:rubredoxin
MIAPLRPPIPTQQVQCPSCGAHKTVAERWFYSHKLAVISQSPLFIGLMGLASIFIFGPLAFKVFDAILGSASSTLSFCLAVLFGFVAWASFSFWSTQLQRKATRVHKYRCQMCGYRWEWREGTPFPRYPM